MGTVGATMCVSLHTIRKVNHMPDSDRITRIHRLFNELHLELEQLANKVSQDTSREYIELGSEIDRLHHFYTDLLEHETPQP